MVGAFSRGDPVQRKFKKSSSASARPTVKGLSGSVAQRAELSWQQGVAHANTGGWALAQASFELAHQGNPSDAVILLNLARAQLRNGALVKAHESALKLLARDADNLLARKIAAESLRSQHRDGEAAEMLMQASPSSERDAHYYQMLGEALFNAGRHEQAVSALFEGLKQDITHALSHYRLGLSFNSLGMKKEAIECLRTALLMGMEGGELAARSLVAFMEHELCRWGHAREDMARLRELAEIFPRHAAAWASVFAFVTLIDSPAEQLHVAQSCARFYGRGIEPMPQLTPRSLGQRLRVGFVSSDLHQHATAILMAEVFEKLDRQRFDITLYSHGPDDRSPMRERLKRAGDRFFDVSQTSDRDVAEQIRREGVEVLVDLKGHTRDSRLGIFAYRPAPVQVSFLGFPGTTGADYIDYFIGDEVVSPPSQAQFYSEKLALMPGCYQPNDQQRPRPQPMTRAQAGLPDDALVLCGFNQPFKLSPDVFDVWCRLLQRLSGAVLWLLKWNDEAPEALRQEAQARGIDPARLIFAPRVGVQEHISRFALADVYLDAWPCNGHTTVSDALWAGVPVVTFYGQSFASRVAASLLRAVHLEEWAADSVSAYEEKVITLAQSVPTRQAVREHLVRARDSAPLFDSETYTRDFGDLLWRMGMRWSQGLTPELLLPAERAAP